MCCENDVHILSSRCGLLEFIIFIEGFSFFPSTKNETVLVLRLEKVPSFRALRLR